MDELKKETNSNFKEENVILSCFDFVKKYAFAKIKKIRKNVKIKDIFIAKKFINFLIKIDSERNRNINKKEDIKKKVIKQIESENSILNLQYNIVKIKKDKKKNKVHNKNLKYKLIEKLKEFKNFKDKIIS